MSEAPRLDETVATLLLLVALGAGLLAFLGVIAALLPRQTARAHSVLDRRLGLALGLGLLNYLCLGGAGLLLTRFPVVALIGVLLLTLLTLITLLGLPALARLVGERLGVLRGRPGSAFGQIVWGGIALELACLLPILGWVILFPLVLALGCGATLLAWLDRSPRFDLTPRPPPRRGEGESVAPQSPQGWGSEEKRTPPPL